MNKRIARWLTAAAAVVAAAVAAAAPHPAGAQVDSAPPLTGEMLIGDTVTTTGVESCNQEGTSTFHFTATGIAIGPYEGTFEEDGTVTITPRTEVRPGIPGIALEPAVKSGLLVSFDVAFTMFSGSNVVEGTKHLVETVPGGFPSNLGVCTSFTATTVSGGSFTNASGTIAQAHSNLHYEATIQTPTGSTTDEGDSAADVESFAACASRREGEVAPPAGRSSNASSPARRRPSSRRPAWRRAEARSCTRITSSSDSTRRATARTGSRESAWSTTSRPTSSSSAST